MMLCILQQNSSPAGYVLDQTQNGHGAGNTPVLLSGHQLMGMQSPESSLYADHFRKVNLHTDIYLSLSILLYIYYYSPPTVVYLYTTTPLLSLHYFYQARHSAEGATGAQFYNFVKI